MTAQEIMQFLLRILLDELLLVRHQLQWFGCLM